MTVGYDLAAVRLRPPPKRGEAGGEWDWFYALSFGRQQAVRRRMAPLGMGPDDLADLVGADVDTAAEAWQAAVGAERLGATITDDEIFDNSGLLNRAVSAVDVAAVLDDLVGPSEIAGRLGVKPRTVHQWRARGLMPEVATVLTTTPIWWWSDVEAWAKSTDRL